MAESTSVAAHAKAPGIGAFLREVADVPVLAAAPLRAPVAVPRTGAGQPLLVLPGFLANDAATSLLRRSLTAAGYRAYGWRMGRNVKIHADMLDRLKALLDSVRADSGGQDVTLVGWSLGGLYARLLANTHPEGIRMVMSLGSPFCGDLHANNAWRLIERTNGAPVDSLPIGEGFRAKPPVHTVAVWSKRDGIVAPETSCGDPDQSDERIELTCTHMGFCASAEGVRDVVRLVAERL